MPKRYYCDFCDKSFADNPVARKNHMNGSVHQRNRKQHYDSFRDPEIILFEEINKKPCKHFMQSGTCNFLENCRFSHLKEDDIEKLKRDVAELKNKSNNGGFETQIDEFSEEKFKTFLQRLTTSTNKVGKFENEVANIEVLVKPKNSGLVIPKYPVPVVLQTISNLPPSLIPPPTDCFLTLEHEDWG